MKFDSTVGLAFLVTLVSFVSPIVVNVVNNRHIRKMKELDIQQENFKVINLHKREIFENYLKIIGKILYEESEFELGELTSAYYLLLPYIPKDEAENFRYFSDKVAAKQFSELFHDDDKELLHDHIIPTIKSEIDKLRIP